MGMLVALVISLVSAATANGIQGTGTSLTTLPNWIYSYSSINKINVTYNITSGMLGLQEMINGTEYYDFAFTDLALPTPEDFAANPYVQVFPLLSTSIVPQINFPAIINHPSPLVLSREVIVAIFMGNITKWNHPDILATNPNISHLIPPENITVIYRSDHGGYNSHLTSLLHSFSDNWTYGIDSQFPSALQNLSNMIPAVGPTVINAKIISFPYSIGYAGYPQVVRDKSIQAACVCIKHRDCTLWDGYVCATPETIAAAISSISLNRTHLYDNTYALNSHNPYAWTSASYVNAAMHTNPPNDRCYETREFYKFLRWVLLDSDANAQSALDGYAPLDSKLADLVLSVLGSIPCGENVIGALQPTDKRSYVHTLLISFNSVFLVFVVGLSIAHLYLFRSSTMNQVYTAIFLLGSGITLSAPYVWGMIANRNSICLGRAWLTSMGLALLLGTMFSRTWQLKDIYDLNKKAIENMQTAITVRSSLIKLGLTLFFVAFANCLLLLIWTVVDPYTAVFKPLDPWDLTGGWVCQSRKLSSWMFLEITFLMFLIVFGVYVIYKTWSFQRSSVIRETRWVLLVLYNIILNVVAAFPSAVTVKSSDETLSVLMIASLMFSGGGIVLAFLLPRILRRWRHRHNFKDSSRESGAQSPSSSPYHHHSISQISRNNPSIPETPKNQLKVKIPYVVGQSEANIGTVVDPPRTYSTNQMSKLSSKSELSPATPSLLSIDRTSELRDRTSELQRREIELTFTKTSSRIEKGGPTPSSTPSIQLRRSEAHDRDSEEDDENPTNMDLLKKRQKEEISDVSITPSTRQIYIPTEDQRLLETPDRSPPPALNWSSNPLQGTETNTPIEEESSRDL